MRREHIADNSESRWYAVWIRSRQEKATAKMLDTLGVNHFLPLRTESRQWSDRKQSVSVPLFSGYLFVSMDLVKDSRLQVLKLPGVVGFVGNHTGPLAIPKEQIEGIQTVMTQPVDCHMVPYLEEGDRVRVVRGVLCGVEGRLLRMSSCTRLVLSIELIHQSVAVSVSREDVEPLTFAQAPDSIPLWAASHLGSRTEQDPATSGRWT